MENKLDPEIEEYISRMIRNGWLIRMGLDDIYLFKQFLADKIAQALASLQLNIDGKLFVGDIKTLEKCMEVLLKDKLAKQKEDIIKEVNCLQSDKKYSSCWESLAFQEGIESAKQIIEGSGK